VLSALSIVCTASSYLITIDETAFYICTDYTQNDRTIEDEVRSQLLPFLIEHSMFWQMRAA